MSYKGWCWGIVGLSAGMALGCFAAGQVGCGALFGGLTYTLYRIQKRFDL